MIEGNGDDQMRELTVKELLTMQVDYQCDDGSVVRIPLFTPQIIDGKMVLYSNGVLSSDLTIDNVKRIYVDPLNDQWGCQYCNGRESFKELFKNQTTHRPKIKIDCNGTGLFYEISGIGDNGIQFNYCPMCGKSLYGPKSDTDKLHSLVGKHLPLQAYPDINIIPMEGHENEGDNDDDI